MAENVVEILVRSKDKTKAGFVSAEASAEASASAVERIWAKHGANINKGLAGIGKVGGGLGAAGGLLAGGAGALAIAGPLAGATAAMGAFGAVAVGEFKKVNTATKTNTVAQQTYNNSIASAKATYDKQMAAAEKQLSQAKTAQQRQAALNKEHQAAAQLTLAEDKALGIKDKSTTHLTSSEQQLAKATQGLQKMWSDMQTAMAPVILAVTKLAVQLAKDFMPTLGMLATAGANVITSFLEPLDALVKSIPFKVLISEFASWGDTVAQLAGPVMVKLLNQLLTLFVDLMPAGYAILKALLPAIVAMVTDLTPLIVVLAKVVAVSVQWLDKNRLLVPVLFALLGAFLAVKVGIVAGLLQIGKAVFAAMGPWGILAAAVLVAVLLIIKYHKQIWDFIKKTWNDIKNFLAAIIGPILDPIKKMWDQITKWWGSYGAQVKQLWHALWTILMTIARAFWAVLEPFLKAEWALTVAIFKVALATIQTVVRIAWNLILTIIKIAWSAIRASVKNSFDIIVGIFQVALDLLTGRWGKAWRDLKNIMVQVWNNIAGFIKGIPGLIRGFLGNAGSLLSGWGHGVIQGLLNGMSNIIGSVWTFIKGIPGKILHFLGIKSPPQWAIDAGKHIMNGLGIGMSQAKNILGKAVTASTAQFSSQALAGSVGGGVARWRGLVQKALKMEGLSLQLTDAVLYQMQTESGGRVNAINLTDSNAARGTPSKGLLQVIDPTFRAYHWPGTSGNIYDPLANIAAAINYARHNYGPGLRNAQGGIGTGRGYASGGISGGGWAMVGEHGRELVRLPAGSHVYSNADSMGMGGGGGQVVHLQVDGGGQSQVEQFMLWMIRNLVRVKGGGDVQKAFGRV